MAMSLTPQPHPQQPQPDNTSKADKRAPVTLPKPQVEFVRDTATGRVVRVINARGKVREVQLTTSGQDQGRFKSALSSAQIAEPTATMKQARRPAPAPPDIAAKSRDFNLPLPASSVSVKSRVRHLERLLEEEDESPRVEEKSVGIAIPGTHFKEQELRDIERSLESYSLSSSLSPKGSKKKKLLSFTLLSKKSSKGKEDKEEKGEKLTLSEKGSRVAAALKNHLSLSNKRDVLRYIGQLNEDHDEDSAYETVSISSNDASTPMGSFSSLTSSLGSSPLTSSLEMGETQVCLMRSSRHARIFDFSNSQSPIRRAIKQQWEKAPFPLPVWEKERIQAHCFRLLRTSYGDSR